MKYANTVEVKVQSPCSGHSVIPVEKYNNATNIGGFSSDQ